MNKIPALKFKGMNWKAILLFGLAIFFSFLIISWTLEKDSPTHYGGDYLAFWSAGKVADQFGFSMIYNLDKLKAFQSRVFETLSSQSGSNLTLITTLPAPFFSVFMVPFKYLSRIEIEKSYWIWVGINLLILFAYLVFFLKNVFPEKKFYENAIILLLLLASFPVFDNLVNGQLNIFLVVCCGEFIRNAVKKKPWIAGLWLGGMLLKPQVLILLLPILLIQRNWKALYGFMLSSLVIVGSSTLLSGVDGMIAYARLLTGWSEGNSVTAPEAMINWRMIAVYINTIFGSPYGWVLAGVGVVLTLAAVYFLLKKRIEFGTSEWVLTMLGVMSATLAVTWHAHAHMAVVIIPLLLYAVANRTLPEKYALIWVGLTPAAWLGFVVLGAVLQQTVDVNILNYQGMVVAISGFAANLLILGFVYKNSRQRLPAGA
ncbi:MAG: glycosyltransferase family 87 protein [Anaerolineaceae bacterium]